MHKAMSHMQNPVRLQKVNLTKQSELKEIIFLLFAVNMIYFYTDGMEPIKA